MTESCAPGSNQAHETLGIKLVNVFPSPFCPLGKIKSQTGHGVMVMSNLGPDATDTADATA